MKTFIANYSQYRAYDRRLKQEGSLTTLVRINIRGNHLKGPVPVSVAYEAIFQPDERYWEIDEEHPDEEPYPVSYSKDFSTGEDRDFYVERNFELGAKLA
ncbi:hypothetical protein [Halospina denitrificans]|uniref:hypothetical protein n=1 Tax=Halospina denitrificans TaxID=332522 RepID=UPI00105B9558|nr:hypothetical protein [Halospina denitrificans]